MQNRPMKTGAEMSRIVSLRSGRSPACHMAQQASRRVGVCSGNCYGLGAGWREAGQALSCFPIKTSVNAGHKVILHI